MASNVDQPDSAVEETNPVKPLLFTELVAKHEDKIPLAFQITGHGRYSGTKDNDNNSVQLHKGDILWVTKANIESITVSAESSRKKEHPAVLPPGWSGKFKLPLKDEFPIGHVFTSVAELVKDFPIFVTMKEELDVDGVTVKAGARLQLIRQTSTTVGGKFLVCDVIGAGDNVTLPEDLEGQFEKTEQDVTFEIKDVTQRLPLHVVLVKDPSDNGEDDATSGGQHIEGIPDDYTGSLLLKSASYSEAVIWETSNQDNLKILTIPSETKMEVVALEDWTEERSPACDVMELAKSARKDKPVYAVPSEGNEDALKELGIPHDAILALHPAETVEQILVKGSKSPLLVDKQYRGYFKPQTEYGTGQDLVNYGILREVRVTQPYHPTETGLSTLNINDIVKLHQPTPKLFSTDEDNEVLVVELERTSSKAGAKLGVIYVPAHALVGFQEKVKYSVDQKLGQLSHQSQVPISASFTKAPTDGTDEEILREESPLMIQGLFKHPIVTALVLNKENSENNKVIEISDHWKLKLHRVRQPLDSSSPDSSHPIKSHGSVTKVSQEHFDGMNNELQLLLATKNVKRRKKKTGNSEGKRKTWVQRHLNLKSIQQRFSRAPPDHSGQNGQTTEEMTF